MLEEIQVVAYNSHPVHSVLVHFFFFFFCLEDKRVGNLMLFFGITSIFARYGRLCSVKCLVSSVAVTVLLTIFEKFSRGFD